MPMKALKMETRLVGFQHQLQNARFTKSHFLIGVWFLRVNIDFKAIANGYMKQFNNYSYQVEICYQKRKYYTIYIS